MSNIVQIKKLENAFGIKKLIVSINEKNLKNNVIYAPNGVFKSSFAKTFHLLSQGRAKDINDRIRNAPINAEIRIDGKDIIKNNNDYNDKIIVFSNDIMNTISFSELQKNELSRLAIDEELKEQYQEILREIEENQKTIDNHIIDCEMNVGKIKEILNYTNLNSYDFYKKLIESIQKARNISNIDDLPGEILVDKVMSKLDTNFRQEVEVLEKYIEMKKHNSFFDEGFTVFTVEELLKGLRASSYFNSSEERGLVIGKTQYFSYDEFDQKVKEETAKIMKTDEVKKTVKKLTNKIGKKSKNEKILRNLIDKEIEAVRLLKNDQGTLILSKLKQKFSVKELENIIISFELISEKINDFMQEAEKKLTLFEDAIEIFEDRFSPNFHVKIRNKNSAIIGEDLPVLEFTHNKCDTVKLDENKIHSILSSGETTAYNVIKFMVKYENIKHNSPIVILDDVVETFDYGNRYAFIQYIKDMISIDDSNVIILTNNYDFFKNLNSRVEQLKPVCATYKNKSKNVELEDGKHLILNKTTLKTVKDMKELIFVIPFSREIQSYTGNQDYLLKYFHLKTGTKNLTISGLIKKLRSSFNIDKSNTNISANLKQKYFDILQKTCNEIMKLDNNKAKVYRSLNNKIVLALGIRLMFEDILMCGKTSVSDSIKANQTNVLYKAQKSYLKAKFKRYSEKVFVKTPEFIHLNAFMYEPLVDIRLLDLQNLYKESKYFYENPDEVWKLKVENTKQAILDKIDFVS